MAGEGCWYDRAGRDGAERDVFVGSLISLSTPPPLPPSSTLPHHSLHTFPIIPPFITFISSTIPMQTPFNSTHHQYIPRQYSLSPLPPPPPPPPSSSPAQKLFSHPYPPFPLLYHAGHHFPLSHTAIYVPHKHFYSLQPPSPQSLPLLCHHYQSEKRLLYQRYLVDSQPHTPTITSSSFPSSGINSHMEVLEATRPIALVRVRTSTEAYPECPQNLTMSLYLPRRLHSNPPQTGYSAVSERYRDIQILSIEVYILLKGTRKLMRGIKS